MTKLVELVSLPLDESDAAREIYAHFGLAMYLAQCLEQGIIIGTLYVNFIPKALKEQHNKDSWAKAVDEYYEKKYQDLFGSLINQLLSINKIPENIKIKLEESRKIRNRLAHAFFREHDVSWFSSKGKNKMLSELVHAANLFILTDKLLSDFLEPIQKASGITDEYIQEAMNKMIQEAQI